MIKEYLSTLVIFGTYRICAKTSGADVSRIERLEAVILISVYNYIYIFECAGGECSG